MNYHKIIIVGETNIARSFLGETILRGIFSAKGVKDIEVKSRGLIVLFSEPVSVAALKTLRKHDYEIEAFRSSQLTREDLEEADLVLTIKRKQVESIREQYLSDGLDIPCVFLGDFVGKDEEVPELTEDTEEAYEACLKQIEILMENVANRIVGELS